MAFWHSSLLKLGTLASVLFFIYIIFSRFILSGKLVMEGFSIPPYRSVALTFKNLIESRTELGASFAVYEGNEMVLEMFGGHRDIESSTPWDKNTITFSMSITKSVSALCIAHLVQTGYLNYTKSVSHYWPQFGTMNKENISVLQLVSHQAGIVSLNRPLKLSELRGNNSLVAEHLANQEPLLPKDTVGYHGLTYGLYLDQLVRRVDPKSRSIAQYFSDELATPAGVDAYIGVPLREFHRVARLHLSLTWNFIQMLSTFDYVALNMYLRTMMMQPAYSASFNVIDTDIYVRRLNDPSVAALPFASVNLATSASQLAKLFSLFANNGSIHGAFFLSPDLVQLLSNRSQAVSTTSDAISGLSWSCNRGFALRTSPLGSTMIGHLGFGGQMVWSDPQYGVTVSYLTNHLRMSSPNWDRVQEAILQAVYRVVSNRKNQR